MRGLLSGRGFAGGETTFGPLGLRGELAFEDFPAFDFGEMDCVTVGLRLPGTVITFG